MLRPRRLSSTSTPLNADAVAFCPYEGWEHYLACGCYELVPQESPPRRIGRLALMDASGRAGVDALTELCASESTGVLDCSWLPARVSCDGPRLLALATSECTAQLHGISGGGSGGQMSLSDEGCMACEDAGDACMSLAWSPWDGVPAPRLALTSTAGRLYVGELCVDGGLRLLTSWQGHDLEAWSVAFGAHDAHTLYSGADDAMLKRWDLRSAVSHDAECEAPAATAANRRSHGAGVCCISPHPRREHAVLTGSYDECCRLWDARQLRTPVEELNCGGGVWRLKWHAEQADMVVAACMHGGFAILRVGGDGGASEGGEQGAEASTSLEVVARYEEHGTGSALGYGADWAASSHRMLHPESAEPASARRGEDGAEERPAEAALVGATCSFYDRQLHVWSFSWPCARSE